MTQTSLDAFNSIRKELTERQAKVYDIIKRIEARNYYPTIRHIAYMMKVEKNQISGRLTELQDKGLIIDTGNVVSRASVFRTTQYHEREALIEKRQSDKFQNDVRNFTKKWKHKLDDSVIFNLSSYL